MILSESLGYLKNVNILFNIRLISAGTKTRYHNQITRNEIAKKKGGARRFTDEGNAQTAMHVESTQSFLEAPFVVSTHVVASYQAAEELSVA